MTRHAFYTQVYQSLPDEVAPAEDYMITLIRPEEKGMEEEDGELPTDWELPADDEPLRAVSGEMFWLVMDEKSLDVDLKQVWWETFEVSRPEIFYHWEYTIQLWDHGHKSIYKRETFYYTDSPSSEWYLADHLNPKRSGRNGEEEMIRIPEGETVYMSIGAIAEKMLGRIPGLSRRARHHLHCSLVWLWNDYYVDMECNEEFPHPDPYHADLPEEPWGVVRGDWE